MKEFVIRRATRDDEADFVELYIQAYRGLERYAYIGRRRIKAYYRWLLKRDPEGVFIAEYNKRPAGFVCCDANWIGEKENSGAIHELFVRRELRGISLGKKLLLKAVEYLKSKNKEWAELWVGEENNIARNLYKKLGFKEEKKVGKWILMVLHIKPD